MRIMHLDEQPLLKLLTVTPRIDRYLNRFAGFIEALLENFLRKLSLWIKSFVLFETYSKSKVRFKNSPDSSDSKNSSAKKSQRGAQRSPGEKVSKNLSEPLRWPKLKCVQEDFRRSSGDRTLLLFELVPDFADFRTTRECAICSSFTKNFLAPS